MTDNEWLKRFGEINLQMISKISEVSPDATPPVTLPFSMDEVIEPKEFNAFVSPDGDRAIVERPF